MRDNLSEIRQKQRSEETEPKPLFNGVISSFFNCRPKKQV